MIGFTKRIQVDHHQLKRLDLDTCQIGPVAFFGRIRQQSGKNHRMQCLDPAAQDFRKTGQVFNLFNCQTGSFQGLKSSAG